MRSCTPEVCNDLFNHFQHELCPNVVHLSLKIIVLLLLGWTHKVFNQNISQLVYTDIFHDPPGCNLC